MSLMFDDERILERGGMYETDNHINYAQRLLKSMFSAISGLSLTLYIYYKISHTNKAPTNLFKCSTSMEIIGCMLQRLVQRSRCWWMILSTPSVMSHHYQMQFHCGSSNVHMLKNVQKQQGAKEFGLYAIAANATSIALGKDPLKIVYNEARLCHHLIKCFRKETLELFS